MPQFAVVVPHNLGQEEATIRLQRLLEQIRDEHADRLGEVQGEWVESRLSYQFRAMGMPVQGHMHVEEAHVNVVGQLPLAAAFFRGTIEQTIRTELLKALG